MSGPVPTENSPFIYIVVPYRDRLRHLQEFVPHMERTIATRFQILLVEQFDDRPFNRGKLLNIGFSLLPETTTSVCFHDVDMLPLAYCCYSPQKFTTHLASRIEQNGFKLPYPQYFGGVLMVTRADFAAVNGFSNRYWGYGEEDDDLWLRFQLADRPIVRMQGMYKSMGHRRTGRLSQNIQLFRSNLEEALKRTHDERKRKVLEDRLRLEPALFSQNIPEYVPHTEDGLISLRYEIVRQSKLKDFINWSHPVGNHHEVASVKL
jgi:hypothetical protein